MWTLDELVDRVGRALAAEYPGAPNGRVRDLPDRRAIRWYTTTGLVDRPLGMRGRSALYGPRHLLQLVALKRRQAAGRTLAEIQAELAGASDAALIEVARVPGDLLAAGGPEPETAAARTRFWTASAPAAAAPAAAQADATPAPTATTPAAAAAPAAAAPAAAGSPGGGGSDAGRAGPPAGPLGGVALGGGAILVFPGVPTAADRAALAEAARPLIALLADRGLLNPDDGSPS
ncbi:MerR family transcriptional regulator [Jidongwangia harbinensis]|uniref:MerR family transcriptional regulator n=1 Tax=Jidongwangia harbinensis TaxID=2878561 RepID=UPI0021054C55|nr:MerR family transcriptional regulator [Jidongwangia harbinensis]